MLNIIKSLSLFFFCVLSSCTTNDIILKTTKETLKAKFNDYKKNKQIINYYCRPFFTVKDKEANIKGMTKDSLFFVYSSNSNEFEYIDFFIKKNIDPYTFSYSKNGINYLTIDSIVSLDKNFQPLRSQSFQLEKNEDVLYTLYRSPIIEYNNDYLIQIGNSTDTLNYVGQHILRKIDVNSSRKIIKYPEIFKTQYIHYTDAAITFNSDKIYYCFPTIDKIYSFTIDNSIYTNSEIPVGDYLKFNKEKLNDMLYLDDYSRETSYNVNLYHVDDLIVLLQREETNSHNLLVYDADLEFIEKIYLDHPVHLYLVYSDNEKIYFGNLKGNKIISYDFEIK